MELLRVWWFFFILWLIMIKKIFLQWNYCTTNYIISSHQIKINCNNINIHVFTRCSKLKWFFFKFLNDLSLVMIYFCITPFGFIINNTFFSISIPYENFDVRILIFANISIHIEFCFFYLYVVLSWQLTILKLLITNSLVFSFLHSWL